MTVVCSLKANEIDIIRKIQLTSARGKRYSTLRGVVADGGVGEIPDAQGVDGAPKGVTMNLLHRSP